MVDEGITAGEKYYDWRMQQNLHLVTGGLASLLHIVCTCNLQA